MVPENKTLTSSIGCLHCNQLPLLLQLHADNNLKCMQNQTGGAAFLFFWASTRISAFNSVKWADGNVMFLQVYEAVMTAATATTVELIVPGTVSNSSAPHARLLNSNLYQNDPAHPRNSGMPSRPLDATLYALNMEYSSGFLRNEIGKALIGVHFAHLVPADLTDHLEIELEDGEILESGAKTMMHVPGNAQGQIVSATLPPGYSGQVCMLTKGWPISSLRTLEKCPNVSELSSI